MSAFSDFNWGILNNNCFWNRISSLVTSQCIPHRIFDSETSQCTNTAANNLGSCQGEAQNDALVKESSHSLSSSSKPNA